MEKIDNFITFLMWVIIFIILIQISIFLIGGAEGEIHCKINEAGFCEGEWDFIPPAGLLNWYSGWIVLLAAILIIVLKIFSKIKSNRE